MNATPTALANSSTDDLIPGYEKPNKLAKMLIGSMAPATKKAFLGCWGMHRHLAGMDSPLALASMIVVWVRDWGLHEDDAAECLRTMCDPESIAKHKFASDLTTDLAMTATVFIKRRASENLRAARRLPEIAPDEQEKARVLIAQAAANFGGPS